MTQFTHNNKISCFCLKLYNPEVNQSLHDNQSFEGQLNVTDSKKKEK